MDFQSTLFAPDEGTRLDLTGLERLPLTRGAWVDVCRSWLPDADEIFSTLVEQVPWRAERRQMYDRVVDVPRLLHTYMIGDELPHHTLTSARDALSAHYADELGEPFRTAGCCYYRDGRDSVAWHGDTVGRGQTTDTMVAIVSVGDPRKLHLRQRPVGDVAGDVVADVVADVVDGGGEGTAQTVVVEMGHGDLVVMGGSCQRTWEHAVPKVAHAGPRLSVQFRPFNVF